MTEDELYRASTQYRLWNISPERLNALRASTNNLAAESVKVAILRKRAAKPQASSTDASATTSDADGNWASNGKPAVAKVDKPIECLTPEEEKKLVDFYASNMLQMGTQKPLEFPINVAGTAVQFLRRFYLSHSPMDYHPKQIMPAALFLATKTENYHTPLKSFVEKLSQVGGLNELTAENVLAPEFILTQGLRFSFDVRHPHRGLKGFYMELLLLRNIASGGRVPEGYTTRATDELREEILDGKTEDKFYATIEQGYGAAKQYLNNAALLSDAYFLYTPSQILFAAWYLFSPELIDFYIDLKLENTANSTPSYRIHEVIHECAALLSRTADELKAIQTDRKELTRIDKKLYQCRNPEKLDLIGLNKARKRDAGEDGKLDEQKAKKRKLAREKNEKEADDLFGPDLVKPTDKTSS